MTSALPSAARNFGLDKPVDHDTRYEAADEYMDVVYKLWEGSWADGAVKRDKVNGVWTDPALVRPINHKGKWFPDIPGPASLLILPRSNLSHDLPSVRIPPVSSAYAGALPGGIIRRRHNIWREGELQHFQFQPS